MHGADPTDTTLNGLRPSDDFSSKNFPLNFLIEEAVLLLEYKTRAEEGKRQGATGCSTSKLCDQISNVVNLLGGEARDRWDILQPASSEFCEQQLRIGVPERQCLEVVELDSPLSFGEHP